MPFLDREELLGIRSGSVCGAEPGTGSLRLGIRGLKPRLGRGRRLSGMGGIFDSLVSLVTPAASLVQAQTQAKAAEAAAKAAAKVAAAQQATAQAQAETAAAQLATKKVEAQAAQMQAAGTDWKVMATKYGPYAVGAVALRLGAWFFFSRKRGSGAASAS